VEPFWEPIAFLVMEVCLVLAGVFMLLGRRLVFVVLAANAAAAVWKCVRAEDLQLGLGALAALIAVNLVLAAFCYWQWRLGQLR